MHWAFATKRQTATAQASGALSPISTTQEIVPDGGIDYIVRVITRLADKPRSSRQSKDPFVPPYEHGLYVGDVAPDHVALLNKFPVIDDHLLIVTRHFEPQTGMLQPGDFEAIIRVLSSWDGLAFYNSGPEAGASQPHRHLQMVDRAIADNGLPIARALGAAEFKHGIGHSTALPFPHALARMPQTALQSPVSGGAAALTEIYRALLSAIGRPARGGSSPGPYNLLATRNWLWAVPRVRAAHDGIETNALGFAGGLMVANRKQFDKLRAIGPAKVLQAVCTP